MRDEKIRVISVYDPAIDTARCPLSVWSEYSKTRNIALLEPYVIPGKRPTIYTLREIPRRVLFAYVGDAPEGSKLEKLRAFQAAVTMIENLQQNDGDYLPWEPPRDPGYETIREESLDRINGDDILDIGEVAKQHSNFRRSTEGCFHLEPSSAVRWGDYHAHRVDVSRSSQASSSAAASSPAASTPSGTEKTETKNDKSADASA